MSDLFENVLLPALIAGDEQEVVRLLKDHLGKDYHVCERIFVSWVNLDETVEGVHFNYNSGPYLGAMITFALKGYLNIVRLLKAYPLFTFGGNEHDYADFIEAAKNGDFHRIKSLMDSTSGKTKTEKAFSLKGWKGHNIMNMCLLHKSCPVWCLLTMIDNGVGVDGWDYNGFTPLMCAILAGNLECVRFLLDKGADPYCPLLTQRRWFRKDGRVMDGDPFFGQNCELLLSDRRNEEWDDFYEIGSGPTALMYAAAVGNIPILQLMLEVAPSDIPRDGRFEFVQEGPLMFAILYGNLEAVALILNYEEARNKAGAEPFCTAIRNSRTDLLELLLERIPSSTLLERIPSSNKFSWRFVSESESQALIECCRQNNSDYLIRMLKHVDKGVFEIDGGEALFIAIAECGTECVNILVKQPGFQVDRKCFNARIEEYGLTILMQSSVFGRDEFVKMFLEMGANVNIVDRRGKTAVMYAVQNNGVKCMQLLMDARADLEIVDKDGGTIFSAALKGDGSCLEAILKTGKLLDEEGLKLKPVHSQSIKVFGLHEKKRAISVRMALLLMKYNVFEWDWCSIVNRKSRHSFAFAVVTIGLSPGTFMHQNQRVSLLIYAFFVKDVATVRYLLANHYFLANDYRFISNQETINVDSSPELTFLVEKLTLKPLTLYTWSVLSISGKVGSFDAGLGERDTFIDSLPVPGPLKNVLKFNNEYSELCPRHWKKLGPKKGGEENARFDAFVINGKTVPGPFMETCNEEGCICDGLGLTWKRQCEAKKEEEEVEEEKEEEGNNIHGEDNGTQTEQELLKKYKDDDIESDERFEFIVIRYLTNPPSRHA